MSTLIYTTEIENFSDRQMKARKNLFIGLADAILRGKIPERKAKRWAEDIDKYLITEDLKRMSMEEVHKLSLVCKDVSMTEFFPRRELVKAGYMTVEEMKEAEFEAIYL